MTNFKKLLIIFLLPLIGSSSSYSQALNIISWNIQDCGRTKDDSEILYIAQTLRDADLVAIQEVVAVDPAGAQAIGRLADQLNRMGSKWDYRYSDPTNSPVKGQSERYAFLWKTSVLDMIHKPFLDSLLAAEVIREPFIGRFRQRSTKKEFVVVNYHSRRFDQHPEEEVKHFYSYPKRFNAPVIIAGDFNMSEDHGVFYGLYQQGYVPALLHQKTTPKQSVNNGAYLNHAIDNIYLPPGICLEYGTTIDFVKKCTSLDVARMISDHLPVYCRISLN
jgi:deoxyribonuclease-1-like protein